jgi:hypothetical protein
LTIDSGEVGRRRRGKKRGIARVERGQPSGGDGWGRGGRCRPAHGEAEAAAKEGRRGGAPVTEQGKELAGQLREGAVELTVRWLQAEQLQRSGTTVSLCSPAFGRRRLRRSGG